MKSSRSKACAWIPAGLLAAFAALAPTSYAENAVQFSVFDQTDASGNLELRILRCRSALATSHTIDCYGDGVSSIGVLVGGGAFVGTGGTLVESRPIATASGNAWRVSSKGTANHIVTAYAVSVHIKGLNVQVLKNMVTRQSVATTATSVSMMPLPATILGSGFSISRSIGTNGANYSSPSALDDGTFTGWAVATPSAFFGQTLTGFQITMPPGIIEGIGMLETRGVLGGLISTLGGISSATGTVTPGWVPIGYGGVAGGASRVLSTMAMNGDNPSIVLTQTKDLGTTPARGYTIPAWVEARIRPGSHGLCNQGGPLSTDMDSCAAQVCAQDGYCCSNAWDGICVDETTSICGKSCADYTCSAPVFQPDYWNSDDSVKLTNNCYNYATNHRTDTRAQPGSALDLVTRDDCADDPETCLQVNWLTSAALADGLIKANPDGSCPAPLNKIALVIAPHFDYHWLRQDADGTWSHKPGTGTVEETDIGYGTATNLDWSGNVITNPETANLDVYSVFGGYFCTCSSGNEGNGHAVIH